MCLFLALLSGKGRARSVLLNVEASGECVDADTEVCCDLRASCDSYSCPLGLPPCPIAACMTASAFLVRDTSPYIILEDLVELFHSGQGHFTLFAMYHWGQNYYIT